MDVVPRAVQESWGGGLTLRQCVHPSSCREHELLPGEDGWCVSPVMSDLTSAGCPSACRSRPVWPTALAAEGGLLQAVTVLTVSHPPSRVCSPVYREGFYVALSNLPGNIFTILLMGSIGGKILLCESDGCRNDLASVEYTRWLDISSSSPEPVVFRLSPGSLLCLQPAASWCPVWASSSSMWCRPKLRACSCPASSVVCRWSAGILWTCWGRSSTRRSYGTFPPP